MIVEVNEVEFRKHLEKNKRTAAFFHTPFCATCSYARSMLETVTRRIPLDITIVSSNLNVMPSVAEPLEVMTVPLLVLIQDGKPVEKFGAFGKADELYFSLVNFFGENVQN